jgi:putative methionine-R-sulfoxide reductase with GAF domain
MLGMERSTVRLQDPRSTVSRPDRRRRIRHKLYTPVYASFNGPQTGATVDLSELLDLNEDGFCVQTAPTSGAQAVVESQSAAPLEVNHPVKLSLDLPETNGYVHGSGLVVWRDDAGRAGIRFSFLTERGMAALKEWLFVNLLIGCSNHAARAQQLARYREEEGHPELVAREDDTTPAPVVLPFPGGAAAADHAQVLSDLDDARREVRELETRMVKTGKDSSGAIFQLIAERGMKLTGASGAALAICSDGRMVCRGRAGDPAPPLRSEVDVKEGLSGECVRTGRPALCADTRADPRVDAELCRALGIGSFLATPIVSDLRVIGLLEVFSPHVQRFGNAEETVLARLAELVPGRDGETDSGTGAGIHAPVPELRAEEAAPASVSPTTGYGGEQPPELPLEPADKAENPAEEETFAAAGSAAALGKEPVPAADERDAVRQEPTALDDLRAALWDRAPALEQQEAADGVHGDREGLDPEHATARRAHVFHLGLIFSSVAVVALAAGYLLAPTIERHFNGPTPMAQNSAAELPVSSKGEASRVRASTPEDLRRLADQGDAESQFMLGTLYRNGDGVLQNDKQAVEWFQRASDQGYVRALSALGSSYWAGRGVRQDYAQAYFWYQLALAEGDQNTKPLLEGIATQLTREQVASIRQQAEAWLHAHNQRAKSVAD